MSVEKFLFGKLGKSDIYSYIIKNHSGAFAEILDFGGRVRRIVVPDKNGELSNVVLGCDSPQGYLEPGHEYYGAVIGRCANRIRDGIYIYNNLLYVLSRNEGDNHIHGGRKGFHNMIWKCTGVEEDAVCFEAIQRHGTEGYPGNIKMSLTYRFGDDNLLTMSLMAQSDRDTIFNPTNHSYFNLNTEGSDAARHFLEIPADEYMPVDRSGIPTGEILDVSEVMDFRKPKRILTGLKAEKISEDLINRHGYDHNYVLKHDSFHIAEAAILTCVESGRRLKISSNAPGLQFYSGNFLEPARTAVCLEPQYFPDAIHHSDDFYWNPQPILEAGLLTKFEARYEFSVISEEEIDRLTDMDDILDDLQL